MPLDRAQVQHIAALARIGISEDEIDVYAGQLSDIIDQFEALNELDTAGIEPTGHAGRAAGGNARRRPGGLPDPRRSP